MKGEFSLGFISYISVLDFLFFWWILLVTVVIELY